MPVAQQSHDSMPWASRKSQDGGRELSPIVRKNLTLSTAYLLVSLCWIGSLNGIAAGGDAAKGKSTFASLCARCHGLDGKGDGFMKFNPPVADLTSSHIQGRLDVQLFKQIHDGKPNTAMGAWKNALSDEEIWDVLVYVRMLAGGSGLSEP